VIVGDYNLKGTDESDDELHKTHEIDSILANFHYEPHKSQMNDIAIIKVKEDIEYNDRVQPICLPDTSTFKTSEQTGWVSGWGRLNGSDPKAKATILQKTKVSILSDEECQALINKEVFEILKRNVTSTEINAIARLGSTHTQLCGKTKLGSAVCFGDSGGPLVLQNEEDGSFTQVGVVSYGLGKCITERNPPSAYTRVSEYLQFIAIATSANL
jgi:secreted trypsin-like serine protease